MLRIRYQGWLENLVRFVGSFIDNRQAFIRLEDSTTEPFPIRCGAPQGSPFSPILFILYIADIFLEDIKYRYGYADDIALIRTSGSLETNARLLGINLTQILRW